MLNKINTKNNSASNTVINSKIGILPNLNTTNCLSILIIVSSLIVCSTSDYTSADIDTTINTYDNINNLNNYNTLNKSSSIICYKCNSINDPRCGDPFDPYTIARVDCSLRARPEAFQDVPATICRKTVQKVYGIVRVIRDCGYLRDAQRDDKACMKRTGTHDVQIHYCSCTKSLCNAATSTTQLLYKLPTFTTIIIIINNISLLLLMA